MREIVILSVVLAFISVIVTLVSITVHVSIPKLMKHPGELVLIQCFSQLFLDFYWLQGLDSFYR
jgi:hypothetical protein